jgi:hypothetical protein
LGDLYLILRVFAVIQLKMVCFSLFGAVVLGWFFDFKLDSFAG